MNFFEKLYNNYRFNQLKKKDEKFQKFLEDYNHSPIHDFYKNGKRTFSNKELEYWAIIDKKQKGKISQPLKDVIDYNTKYENAIYKNRGKDKVGSIVVPTKEGVLEITLAVDNLTKDLYYDVKNDKEHQKRESNVVRDWKLYDNKYINAVVYDKVKENSNDTTEISLEGIKILGVSEEFRKVLEKVKVDLGTGLNQIHQVETNEEFERQALKNKIQELREENKEYLKTIREHEEPAQLQSEELNQDDLYIPKKAEEVVEKAFQQELHRGVEREVDRGIGM